MLEVLVVLAMPIVPTDDCTSTALAAASTRLEIFICRLKPLPSVSTVSTGGLDWQVGDPLTSTDPIPDFRSTISSPIVCIIGSLDFASSISMLSVEDKDPLSVSSPDAAESGSRFPAPSRASRLAF